MGYDLPNFDDVKSPLDSRLIELGTGLLKKVVECTDGEIMLRNYTGNRVYETLRFAVTRTKWSVEDAKALSWFVLSPYEDYKVFRRMLGNEEFEGLLSIMEKFNRGGVEQIREQLGISIK